MSKSSVPINAIFKEPQKIDLLHNYDKEVPHLIKYMGSKKSLLNFVVGEIDNAYQGGKLCDLFAGTSILSGALGKLVPIHSNDIQEYSAILAQTYLADYDRNKYPVNILEIVLDKSKKYVDSIYRKFENLKFSYDESMTIKEFVSLENKQQKLIKFDFGNLTHHLFIKYYSGTYWSYHQCLWIDALRKVADDYKGSPVYYIIMSSIMHAMSYTSQSTGHFAQYRDATNLSSQQDILLYRRKKLLTSFTAKFKQLENHLDRNLLKHRVTTLDYVKCLDTIEPNSLVYADPPYAFVHYSRFYHALETLVKYDYPKVAHKGRYRTDRHQSPFCKRTEVGSAFTTLFKKINARSANLILSYSNTGMVSLDDILILAEKHLGKSYGIETKNVAYKHSTMGRKFDKENDVQEYLVTAKRT